MDSAEDCTATSLDLACPLWAKSGLMQCSKQRSLFDHLVGGGEQLIRNREAKRPGSSQVDDQIVLLGLHHGQVGRLVTFEYAPDIDAGPSIGIGQTRSVTQ